MITVSPVSDVGGATTEVVTTVVEVSVVSVVSDVEGVVVVDSVEPESSLEQPVSRKPVAATMANGYSAIRVMPEAVPVMGRFETNLKPAQQAVSRG